MKKLPRGDPLQATWRKSLRERVNSEEGHRSGRMCLYRPGFQASTFGKHGACAEYRDELNLFAEVGGRLDHASFHREIAFLE